MLHYMKEIKKPNKHINDIKNNIFLLVIPFNLNFKIKFQSDFQYKYFKD